MDVKMEPTPHAFFYLAAGAHSIVSAGLAIVVWVREERYAGTAAGRDSPLPALFQLLTYAILALAVAVFCLAWALMQREVKEADY